MGTRDPSCRVKQLLGQSGSRWKIFYPELGFVVGRKPVPFSCVIASKKTDMTEHPDAAIGLIEWLHFRKLAL
jgi:hypothetical protein